VTEQTVHAQESMDGIDTSANPGRGDRRRGTAAWGESSGRAPYWVWRLRWILGGLGLLAVAAVIVVWSGVRPGYDPYGWLIWGHLTIHGSLNTDGAPSWKPLPYLFTLPYALLARHALYVWMITAYALSLSGLVFAGRVAYRLIAAPPGRRYVGLAGALVAALGVLSIQHYPHSILSAESDTIVVALCLAALDCILNGRPRWAFWLWWLAALGRPEAWAPTLLYAIWVWWKVPGMRWQLILGLILIPLLWFGIPYLSSKSAFSPGNLALGSVRQVHGNKIVGTYTRFADMNSTAVKLGALIAVGLALLRRDLPVLILAGWVALWVVVEIVFSLHGWSAVVRYMYEAGAGTAVLCGVAVGRVLLDTHALLERFGRPALVWRGLATAISLAALAGFVVSEVPIARARINTERHDLHGQRVRTKYVNLLGGVIEQLGARRILACGQPHIGIGWQSVLAWDLGTDTGSLFFVPSSEKHHRHPIVNMYPHYYGWKVFPSDWANQRQKARCRGLSYRT
jgi:hypothetical protein